MGDMTLDLTGDWRQNADVIVKMGLGSLHLLFPEGLGVKARAEDLPHFGRYRGSGEAGGRVLLPRLESAEHRVTVLVEAAFGRVEVRWVR